MDKYDFQNRFSSQNPQKKLTEFLKGSNNGVILKGLYGSSKACSFSDAAESYNKGVHIVILNNIEQARFFTNDLYGLLSDSNVFYFPTSANGNSNVATIKESSNKVQRSAAINALNDPIIRVDDDSVQGLNAKMRRCVKVRIHYVID